MGPSECHRRLRDSAARGGVVQGQSAVQAAHVKQGDAPLLGQHDLICKKRNGTSRMCTTPKGRDPSASLPAPRSGAWIPGRREGGPRLTGRPLATTRV